MGMEKAKGVDLQFGVTSSGLGGVLEQSSNRSKLGEIKEYKDRDGNTVSAYVTGKGREEVSFEALIQTSAEDFDVGDTATIMGKSGVVTKYEIIESNEDVKKISMTIRTYPDIA